MKTEKQVDRPIATGFSNDPEENLKRLGLTEELYARWDAEQTVAPEPAPYAVEGDLDALHAARKGQMSRDVRRASRRAASTLLKQDNA